MKKPTLLIIGCFSFLLLTSVSFSGTSVQELSRQREGQYSVLYPQYAEFCAFSKISKLPGFGAHVVGNDWGHSTLYLKGACRDLSEGYPLVKICDSDSKETGVGVSTDFDYKTVNWVAVPDRDFFYWGAMKDGEPLTQEGYLETIEQAKRLGILTGVTAFPNIFKEKPTGMADEEFLWQDVMGTDFGINLAREGACGRLPLNRKQLEKIVNYLNEINRKARIHDNQFDGKGNNCTHTAYNALAAAGFWKPLNTEGISWLNLAIPYDEVVAFFERGNDFPLDDLSAVYRDSVARKSLESGLGLPFRHGITFESWSIYTPNEVFDTSVTPQVLEFPLSSAKRDAFVRFNTDPKITSIRANLWEYLRIYTKVKRERPENLAWWSVPTDYHEKRQFMEFVNRYYQWIDEQIADVKYKLQMFGER